MWFKLTYSLAGMYLLRPKEAPATLPLPSGDVGEVVLWVRTIEERDQLCCSVLLERKLETAVVEMFGSLSKNILPQDDPPVVELPYPLSFDVAIGENGAIPDKWNFPLQIMPREFQKISGEVFGALSEFVRRFVKTLRWVQGTAGRQNPFAQVGFEWSQDKTLWRTMPQDLSISLSQPVGVDPRPEALEKVSAVWASGYEEPLGHALIREALDIAAQNPRSALLIGVSALETGLKEYIRFRIPNSEIVFEKMPSPPALTMVQEVIPALHKTLGVDALGFPLEAADNRFLRKWITQRNQVAHGTKETVKVDELIKFLGFVRKLLYTFDVCRGHEWAQALTSDD